MFTNRGLVFKKKKKKKTLTFPKSCMWACTTSNMWDVISFRSFRQRIFTACNTLWPCCNTKAGMSLVITLSLHLHAFHALLYCNLHRNCANSQPPSRTSQKRRSWRNPVKKTQREADRLLKRVFQSQHFCTYTLQMLLASEVTHCFTVRGGPVMSSREQRMEETKGAKPLMTPTTDTWREGARDSLFVHCSSRRRWTSTCLSWFYCLINPDSVIVLHNSYLLQVDLFLSSHISIINIEMCRGYT